MDATTSSATQAEPELGLGQHARLGPNPLIGAALAVLVGVAVFWVMYRIRKTFGMK